MITIADVLKDHIRVESLKTPSARSSARKRVVTRADSSRLFLEAVKHRAAERRE